MRPQATTLVPPREQLVFFEAPSEPLLDSVPVDPVPPRRTLAPVVAPPLGRRPEFTPPTGLLSHARGKDLRGPVPRAPAPA